MDDTDRERLELLISVADDLIRRGGLKLEEHERDYLRQKQEDATKTDGEWKAKGIVVGERRLKNLSDAIIKGFFDAAAEGIEYGKGDDLATNFSRRVESNYPEANDTFIRFARTYWSIKGTNAILYPPNVYLVQGLLYHIESGMGHVFFPFPGHGVDPKIREEGQRGILQDFAPKIDVEDFMKGNAILIRDRQSQQRSSCASVLLVVGVFGLLSVGRILTLVLS